MGKKLAAAALTAVATTTLGSAARADEPKGVDWMKVVVELDRYSRGSTAEKPNVSRRGRPLPASDDPSPQNMGNAWFGVAPRVTLVARDWASSTRLAGDRLSLVDGMRLSASTRMVVGRARLSGARFTPFVQVGLGQWRTDRNYLPFTPHTIEVASQIGGGFELRVARGLQLAAETTATGLLRDGQHSSMPQSMLWSTFIASRVEF